MPRPTPLPTRRDLQFSRYQDLQQQDQRQQALDQGQNTNMLQMLTQLYQINQDQQMAPEKLAALRASTAAQTFENTNEPDVLAAKLRAENAQSDYYAGAKSGELTPHDLMNFEAATGHPYVTPQEKAVQAQQAEAQRQAAIAADQAQQSQGGAAKPGPPGRSGGLVGNTQGMGSLNDIYNLLPGDENQKLLQNIIKRNEAEGVYNTPPWLQHPVNSIWNALFGKPTQ